MNYCCSCYTLGIILGSFYATGSLLVFVFGLIAFVQLQDLNEDSERVEDLKFATLELASICGVTAIISFLFIMAIFTRYQYLIIPWLLLGVYNFFITCRISCAYFMDAARVGTSSFFLFLMFIVIILILGLEVFILYFSFLLFSAIRAENIEKEKVCRLVNEEESS